MLSLWLGGGPFGILFASPSDKRGGMRWHSLVIGLFSVMSAVRPVVGQTAVFAGAVVRDTLSHGLSGATVAIPALKRSDTTDAQGEFKMTGLAAGRYAAVIRRIGFKPIVDTVVLVSGQSVEREYVLDPTAVELDSVRVSATKDAFVSPRLAQFEEDRKYAIGGHFLTDSVLRKYEDREFQDVLTSFIPGVRSFSVRPGAEYLSSGRGTNCRLSGCLPVCPVTLWIDGVKFYDRAIGGEIPDFKLLQIRDFAGAEYYAGGASVPLKYGGTGGGCGVLVLWHREKL